MADAKQVAAAVSMVAAIAETVRELGSVESSKLYAQLMGVLPFEEYQQILGILGRAELVSNENHVLRWTGPTI